MDATASPTRPPAPAGGTHTHPAPFQVDLHLKDGYAFDVDPRLPGVDPFVVDEPPPLGGGRGPNPTRLLATAVSSCLGSSLLFSMRKLRIDVRDLAVHATGMLTRNERGRLRVASIDVELVPTIPEADRGRLARCVEIFEDYCVVTQSIRPGVDVRVTVTPATI
jgi:organic hydroperoxide reductase OsmC/OhrA